MFGGLDLKGGVTATASGETKKEGEGTVPSTMQTSGNATGSAFSFLSGHGALSSGDPSTENPSSASASAFDFLRALPQEPSGGFGAVASAGATTVTTIPSPSRITSTGPVVAGAPVTSAFAFLSTSPSGTVEADEAEATTATTTLPLSSFSFLQPAGGTNAAGSLSGAVAAHPAETSAAGSGSGSAATSANNPSFLAAPPAAGTTPPTGAGVTFARSAIVMPSTSTTIKKKAPRTRVGVGAGMPTAGATTASVPQRSTPPPPPPPVIPSTSTTAAETITTRGETSTTHATTRSPPHIMNGSTSTTQDGDDILALARAAAEEAQAMQKQQSGFLGGLFRRGSGNNTNSSHHSAAMANTGTTSGGTTGTNSTAMVATTAAMLGGDRAISGSSSTVSADSTTGSRPPSGHGNTIPTNTHADMKRTLSSGSSGGTGSGSALVPQSMMGVGTSISFMNTTNTSTTTATDPSISQPFPTQSSSATTSLVIPMYDPKPSEDPLPFVSTVTNAARKGSSSLSTSKFSFTMPSVTTNTTSSINNNKGLDSTSDIHGHHREDNATPTERFQTLISAFRDQVVQSMSQFTKLRQQRIGLLEERFLTLAKERLACQQKQQAEAQQMAAAEAEDFEVAHHLSTVMDAHERERIEYAAVVEGIGRAIQQLDTQKGVLVKQLTQNFQQIQKQLHTFQAEIEGNDIADAAEQLKKFAVISKQISAEQERLEQDWKHIERDEQLVEEECKELEAAISEQSLGFDKLREDASLKLKSVEQEIEALRKLLQEKQAVAAGLRTEIAGHEESILKVRVKFTRQLDRVKKKRSTIQDNREEWQQEKAANERQREEHEAKVKRHSEALLAREALLEQLQKEVEMSDSFEAIIAKELSFGQDEEEGQDDELAHLQAEVVKSEAALSESKEVLKAATKALNNLREEIVALETRLPQLEEEKKIAAGKRDFKAAGAASKESKEAIARLQVCKEEVEGGAVEKVTLAEEEVRKQEALLERAREIAREKEKETGLAAMQRLADNIKRLAATKSTICGDADPLSVRGVGAYVLDGQIHALLLEGETYGEKYGGWNELIADCNVGQDRCNERSHDECVGGVEHDSSVNNTAEMVDGINDPADAMPESCETEIQEEKSEPKPVHVKDERANIEAAQQRFRELTDRLQAVEADIDAAAVKEDFDKAAELDEILQGLLAEVQALNLTDEEMELALAVSGESVDTPVDDGSIEAVSESHNISTPEINDARPESYSCSVAEADATPDPIKEEEEPVVDSPGIMGDGASNDAAPRNGPPDDPGVKTAEDATTMNGAEMEVDNTEPMSGS